MKTRALVCGVLACSCSLAYGDENGFYAEIGYSQYGIDIVDQDFDPSAIQLRAGYRVSPFIGFEAEVSDGFSGASVSAPNEKLTVRVDQTIAGFAVGRWPVTDRVDLFGRVGYQAMDVSVKGEVTGQQTVRQSGDGEGIVYGGGAEYRFGKFGVRADYTWSSEASPFPASDRIETLSIGVTHRF